jgi:hypothetical protein
MSRPQRRSPCLSVPNCPPPKETSLHWVPLMAGPPANFSGPGKDAAFGQAGVRQAEPVRKARCRAVRRARQDVSVIHEFNAREPFVALLLAPASGEWRSESRIDGDATSLVGLRLVPRLPWLRERSKNETL